MDRNWGMGVGVLGARLFTEVGKAHSLLPIPYPLLPKPYSLLPIPYPLLLP